MRVAQGDPVFQDGYFVERYDERCWQELTGLLKQLVLDEAAAGNKVVAIGAHQDPWRIYVRLSGPAKRDLSELPDGLVLRTGFTPEFPVYDCDLYAVFDTKMMHHVSFAAPKDEGDPR